MVAEGDLVDLDQVPLFVERVLLSRTISSLPHPLRFDLITADECGRGAGGSWRRGGRFANDDDDGFFSAKSNVQRITLIRKNGSYEVQTV